MEFIHTKTSLSKQLKFYTYPYLIAGGAGASEEPGDHGEDHEVERRRPHLNVLQIDFPIQRKLFELLWHYY